MKRVIWMVLLSAVASGCVAGGNVSHEDNPGTVKRESGPVLCRDGTAPPCVPRD